MINEQSILGETIFALVFITGCGSADVGLTPTQQVYEVIMNERMQDPLREVIILSETEGQLLADANIEGLAYHIELAGGVPDNLVELLIASANVHQNRLNAVARQLNERPRETLHFETPAERFNQCVASIG